MKHLTLAIALLLSLPFLASAADQPEATTYQIRNAKYAELLRPRDANNANGTPIVLYPAQPWKCMTWRLVPGSEASFHVKNLFTSKTFAANAGTNATQRVVTQVPLGNDSGSAPSWQFTKLADGKYKITEPHGGQTLTAGKAADGSDATIVLRPWQDQEEQKWVLEPIDTKDLTM